ncbi:hypothetical protein CK203_032876 [Vitis vinifera]|uniref:Uncharacterized protein n=1 Tax=Vitis vinifera TaxID=29760 RepID=A0A438HL62_VITVI|nr:hypothetical protein CK203_032876 [Vitis vinifera]
MGEDPCSQHGNFSRQSGSAQKSKLCDSLGGPPVTAQRIRLKDGRWLAYSETGVPRDKAKFKIILAHGFTGSRLDLLRASPVTFPF